jgi:hypothetical protein
MPSFDQGLAAHGLRMDIPLLDTDTYISIVAEAELVPIEKLDVEQAGILNDFRDGMVSSGRVDGPVDLDEAK